jgi:hypothetical protein
VNTQEANDGGKLEKIRGSPYRDAASTNLLSAPPVGDALPIGGATNTAMRVLQQPSVVIATTQIDGRSGNERGPPCRDIPLNAQSPPVIWEGVLPIGRTTNSFQLQRRQYQVTAAPLGMTTPVGNGRPIQVVIGDSYRNRCELPLSTPDGLQDEVDENTPPSIGDSSLMDNTELNL